MKLFTKTLFLVILSFFFLKNSDKISLNNFINSYISAPAKAIFRSADTPPLHSDFAIIDELSEEDNDETFRISLGGVYLLLVFCPLAFSDSVITRLKFRFFFPDLPAIYLKNKVFLI